MSKTGFQVLQPDRYPLSHNIAAAAPIAPNAIAPRASTCCTPAALLVAVLAAVPDEPLALLTVESALDDVLAVPVAMIEPVMLTLLVLPPELAVGEHVLAFSDIVTLNGEQMPCAILKVAGRWASVSDPHRLTVILSREGREGREASVTFFVSLVTSCSDTAGHAFDEGGGAADAFWVEIAGGGNGV